MLALLCRHLSIFWMAACFFLLFVHVYQIHNENLIWTPNHATCVSWKTSQHKPFPRKIWQSWKDDSEDPTDRTKGLPHQWRSMNPEHRYERMTDANADAYVYDNFPANVSNLFSSMGNPVMKADYLRYLILLNEGGVWADIDVRARKPVSMWVPEEYRERANIVIGIERDHNKKPIWENLPYSVQLAQYVVLAKPHQLTFDKLVRLTEQNIMDLLVAKHPGESMTFSDIMGATGPGAFTKIFMDYFTEITGEEHNGTELNAMQEPQLIGDVLVLPMIKFGALGDVSDDDPSVLVKHFFQGSWLCKSGGMIDNSPADPNICNDWG